MTGTGLADWVARLTIEAGISMSDVQEPTFWTGASPFKGSEVAWASQTVACKRSIAGLAG